MPSTESPNLGNTYESAFFSSISIFSKSISPPIRIMMAKAKRITKIKDPKRNRPALLVASLMIYASLLPLFLLSSMYSSNSFLSLSLSPSNSFFFLFSSLYYRFFLSSGSFAIFSCCSLILAYLSYFYFSFLSVYCFFSSLYFLTACLSWGKNAKITIALTTPIAMPNMYIYDLFK